MQVTVEFQLNARKKPDADDASASSRSNSLGRAAFAGKAGLPAETPVARRLVGGDGLEPPTLSV